VIVLGDLNDEPTAATTQILLGPSGSEIGTPGFERPDQGDGSRRWNLAPLIPEERRFSRVFRGRGELIDHILVSQALVQQVEQVDTGPGEPPRSRRTRPSAATSPPRTTSRSSPASASAEGARKP
jgi:endonuclease/exonuclease/phosphatase family metal-dependent hydrolase